MLKNRLGIANRRLAEAIGKNKTTIVFSHLYQFLICNQHVCLPGIGTFIIDVTSGKTDIVNKVILPPEYAYQLDKKIVTSEKYFFTWLALQINVTEHEAVKQLHDFSFEIKKLIQDGKKVVWKGVGVLQPGTKGDIDFVPEKKNFVFELPVIAEKVVRRNAEHVMLVGDKQKTSLQMTEILAHHTSPEIISSSIAPAWWAIAIVLSFAAIMLIGWHFSEYGFGVTSTGTTKKVSTHALTPTYKKFQ